MTTLALESTDGRVRVVDVPEGGRLIDLCDANDSPVPFSCRSSSCGTCRIDVLEGHEHLDPPAAEEREVLALFGDDPSRRRLACQARLRAGPGRIRVRPTAD
jgi:ferredoxin